jgi:hypothetical protein
MRIQILVGGTLAFATVGYKELAAENYKPALTKD